MKITINTQEDSKEDIKRAISFLSGIVNSSSTNLNQNHIYANNGYNEDKQEVQPIMNMFGTSDSTTTSQDSVENSVEEKIEKSQEPEDTFDETARLIPY